MRLPCRCQIEPQYLPLNGGEREVTCEHAKWVIQGRRETTTTFHITKLEVQVPVPDTEDDDDQGAADNCGCGQYQFRHTVGDHYILDRQGEGQ